MKFCRVRLEEKGAIKDVQNAGNIEYLLGK